jgi:hypothetical protein
MSDMLGKFFSSGVGKASPRRFEPVTAHLKSMIYSSSPHRPADYVVNFVTQFLLVARFRWLLTYV